MNARLLQIETRRGVGMAAFPVLIGLAWWSTHDRLPSGGTVWLDLSLNIGSSMLFLAPAAAALTAWMAGRDRRRRMDDLLATTPLPPIRRELATWAGTSLWPALAYLAAGSYVMVMAMREATWGGPPLSPILVGLLTVVMGAAVGFTAGTLVPSRFTAPLVAIALFFSLGWMPNAEVVPWRLRLLSPLHFLDFEGYTVLFGLKPDRGGPIAVWLVGITISALAIVAFRHGLSGRAGAALTIGVGLIVAGLALTSPDRTMDHAAAADVVPYAPVCGGTAIPVCVHPAYEAWLPRTARLVDSLVSPLAGIPGVPERATQYASQFGPPPVGTLNLQWVIDDDRLEYWLSQSIALELVGAPGSHHGSSPAPPQPSQSVVAIWLIRQAGQDPALPETFVEAVEWDLLPFTPELTLDQRNTELRVIKDAVNRFAALDVASQRAWLEAHYSDLVAGRLHLKDLP